MQNLCRVQERSLLALSAGLGEEVFFRGFMQPSIALKLADVSWSAVAKLLVQCYVGANGPSCCQTGPAQ